MRFKPAVIASALVVLSVNGCGPIKQLTTGVDPAVFTVARTGGGVDVVNNCASPQPPAPPLPAQWWSALPVAQPPKVAGQGIVGFDLWRNTTGTCREFRQDLYRTEFVYPLAPVSALKGLVTKAELTLSVAILPATLTGAFCQPMTGAGGSLLMLPAGSTKPAAAFTTLPPLQPFRAGARVFAMTFPWLPGPIPNNTTTAAAGGNRAGFTVDVTARLNDALARGDSALAFSLSGSDETIPAVPPPVRFDCRTVYQIGQLVITHL